MKRKPPEPQQDGCALWVVTFGDAMSLLVTFFVMLVSFASFEESSLMTLVGAMKGGLRVAEVPLATAVGSTPEQAIQVIENATSLAPTGDPSEVLPTANSMQEPDPRLYPVDTSDYFLQLLDNGVSLVIRSGAVFESGTATIRRPDSEVWRVAAGLMSIIRSEIRVTAKLPANTMVRLDSYKTAWGLGIEQSLEVDRFLVERFGVEPGQISTAVRVVGVMQPGEASEGTVEIRYLGADFLKLKDIPKYILKGEWRSTPPPTEAQ